MVILPTALCQGEKKKQDELQYMDRVVCVWHDVSYCTIQIVDY